ncbi:hypothetical protein OC861_003610 [Tilletia horrida]|nr:hypothetical protein OC861_003610 [Tilletia horrida]
MKTSFSSTAVLAVLFLGLSVNAAPSAPAKRALNQICYQDCIAHHYSECERCCTFSGNDNLNPNCFGNRRRDVADESGLPNDA